MLRLNVLWVIDHVCYDGDLHGGGRLFWNVLPRFDPDRVRVVPCLLRATEEIREVFRDSPVPVRILDKPKFDPTTLWTFLRLIKSENIQVMHLHCYASSTFGRLAGLLAGVPTIIHDYDTEVYFPYPKYLGVADRLLGPATGHAMAASPMCRTFMMRKRHIDAEKISQMFHAIPPHKFSRATGEALARVREELDIAADAPIVATITKLGPQRGNEFLLESAARVIETLRDAVFIFVYRSTRFHRLPNKRYVEVNRADRDSQVGAITATIDRLGIGGNVRLLEQPENVDDVLSTCDLFVVPFLSERFSSVKLLEAMAKGKPVIATEMGEQSEVITPGVNGSLVPPGDVEAMSRAIAQLLGDRVKLESMGNAARTTAEGYSADTAARRLEEMYEKLASGKVVETGKVEELA